MIFDAPLVTSALAISALVFACVFGGALLGLRLRDRLPSHHLGTESRDTLKLGIGLIATMSALVLSLLLASAKGSADAQRNELIQMSANVVLLDRVLAHYGDDSRPARAALRAAGERMLAEIWPRPWWRQPTLEPSTADERFYDQVRALAPATDAQRTVQADAQRLAVEIGRARWLIMERRGTSIPMPFLLVLALWLGVIFLCFGLLAPSNTTVVVTFVVCAVSIASAIFLIVELDRGFGGILRISSAPLRAALEHLGR